MARRRYAFAAMAVILCTINPHGDKAMAAEGLISVRSNFGPKQTVERLEAAVSERGLTVFARIDHAAGAEQAGMPLRPTGLLIFGSPKGGTPLMQSAQTAGIDLPLKALVWQDDGGTTWLSYNDPRWIALRHGAGPDADAAVSGMFILLQSVASAAATLK